MSTPRSDRYPEFRPGWLQAQLDSAVPLLTPSEQSDMAMRLAALEGFAHWLIDLDEPGNEGRRIVTLTQIIQRARKALRVEATT